MKRLAAVLAAHTLFLAVAVQCDPPLPEPRTAEEWENG